MNGVQEGKYILVEALILVISRERAEVDGPVSKYSVRSGQCD